MSIFRINTNVSALNSQRQLASSNSQLMTAQERLSTGKRINSAADDASGLAVSEKLTTQTRGWEMASRNAQDGISMLQTAEGALHETHSNLQRMRELAVQAANDTLTKDDRLKIQKEIDNLAAEVQRTADQTQFNEKNLLDGNLQNAHLQVGPNEGQITEFSIQDSGTEKEALDVAGKANVSFPDPKRARGFTTDRLGSDLSNHNGLEGEFRVRETENKDGETIYELVTIEGRTIDFFSGPIVEGEKGRVVAKSRAHEDPTNVPGISPSFLGQGADEPVDAGIIWRGVEGTIFEDNNGNVSTIIMNHQVTEGTMQIENTLSENAVVDLSKTQTIRADANDNLQSGQYTVRKRDASAPGFDHVLDLINPNGELVGRTNGDSLADESTNEIFYEPGTIGTPDEEIVLDLSRKMGVNLGDSQGALRNEDTPFSDEETLFIGGPEVASGPDGIDDSLSRIDQAISEVSKRRANLGATINRLESTIRSNDITAENLKAARSRIRDADVAEESVRRTRANILIQAGTAVLAQANQNPQLGRRVLQ